MHSLGRVAAVFLLLCCATSRADLVCVGGGKPCGGGCTLPGGHCENGQCFGPDGSWNLCLPSVGGDAYGGGPFGGAPFGAPMRGWAMPDPFRCGSERCQAKQFCDLTAQKCRDDTCENQFKYGCSQDKSSLQRVDCPDSLYTDCWESKSGSFICYRGPHDSQLSCQAAENGAAAASASGGAAEPSAKEPTRTLVSPTGPATTTTTMDQPGTQTQISQSPGAMAAGMASGDRTQISTSTSPGQSSSFVSSTSGGGGSGAGAFAGAGAGAGTSNDDYWLWHWFPFWG